MSFLVGNPSGARFYSKVVALQIKVQWLGLFGERYTFESNTPVLELFVGDMRYQFRLPNLLGRIRLTRRY